MKKVELEKELFKRFEEYKNLVKDMVFYSASVRLGEIYNCIQNDSQLRSKWLSILNEISFDRKMIEDIDKASQNDYSRLLKILSYGDEYDEDELLLILTLRVQLDLCSEFMAFKKLHLSYLNMERLDELISKVIEENDKSYSIAVKLINKNWGLPISASRYLGSE